MCALVTGVQTCSLPIGAADERRLGFGAVRQDHGDLAQLPEYVCVGEDEPVLADDDAGPGALEDAARGARARLDGDDRRLDIGKDALDVEADVAGGHRGDRGRVARWEPGRVGQGLGSTCRSRW